MHSGTAPRSAAAVLRTGKRLDQYRFLFYRARNNTYVLLLHFFVVCWWYSTYEHTLQYIWGARASLSSMSTPVVIRTNCVYLSKCQNAKIQYLALASLLITCSHMATHNCIMVLCVATLRTSQHFFNIARSHTQNTYA